MSKVVDLVGKKFGNLTVIEFAGQNKHHSRTWLCRCDCGNTTVVTTNKLTTGNTKSCGCLKLNQQKIMRQWKI